MAENNNYEGQASKIKMDRNPMRAKATRNMISDKPLESAIPECVEEWLSGVRLNEFDIPMYLVALKGIETALKTMIEDIPPAMRLYEDMLESSEFITFKAASIKGNSASDNSDTKEDS